MSSISRAYGCQFNNNARTYLICTVCEQPAFVMVRSCHTWVNFVPRASLQCCALVVALHRHDSGLGISHAQRTNRVRSVFMKYLNVLN